MASRKPKQQTSESLPVGWRYRWNDTEVDEETFNRLTKEHQEWVEEQARKAINAAIDAAKEDKPKRKKK